MVVAGKRTVRYAISDLCGRSSSHFSSSHVLDARETRRLRWLRDVERWAVEGINVIQLREKSLDAGETLALAEAAVHALQSSPLERRPRLLINGRPDIACAAYADGVHLTARPGELRPAQARAVFEAAGRPRCLVSLSCHTLAQIKAARDGAADLILFGPVFEKRVGEEQISSGLGLDVLQAACDQAFPVPVLALGGVTPGTTPACLQAGASGIAGIRLFGS